MLEAAAPLGHNLTQVPGQIAPRIGPQEELLARLNPNLPPQFHEACERTVGYVGELDADPAAAIQDPAVRTFVQEVGRSGFVGSAYVEAMFGGPGPEQTLPTWLQQDFLERHGLTAPPELNDEEQREADGLFASATADFPYDDHRYGRYFRITTGQNEAGTTAQQFKCYVESHELLDLLRNNQLGGLLDELGRQNVSPGSFKLFERSRLALYFKQPVGAAGDQVRQVMAARGIEGRGPAQDVFQIVQGEQGLELETCLSNDAALGDGGRNPVRYLERAYDAGTFTETYLKHCLYAGKDPSEPYKTSFVYFVTGNARTIDPALVEQAEQLAGYPVIVNTSRLATSLLSSVEN